MMIKLLIFLRNLLLEKEMIKDEMFDYCCRRSTGPAQAAMT